LLSIAVTVTLYGEAVSDFGVPEIKPVDVFTLSPVGRPVAVYV
jgi:hypothetical protein